MLLLFVQSLLNVSDGPLELLAQDNRLVRHYWKAKDEISTDIKLVHVIPDRVWKRFAAVIGSTQWKTLRSDAIVASVIAAAYFDDLCLAQVREYPYSLAVGDVNENLDALSNVPAEELKCATTLKIKALLDSVFPREVFWTCLSVFSM